MKLIKTKDYNELSKVACELTINYLKELVNPVLGLATGSTPEGLYSCLIDYHKKTGFSFADVKSFNLDEYIGLSEENENSYHYYMNEKLFSHIDIKPENTHVPNGMATDFSFECDRYEKEIKLAKGINLQLLGLGVNGHIGFNEPGTSFQSTTQVITLDKSTRNANAHFFASQGEVPKQAISMGIKSIMETEKIILLASGTKKANALYHLLEGDITEAFPASILNKHADVTIIADEDALSKIK